MDTDAHEWVMYSETLRFDERMAPSNGDGVRGRPIVRSRRIRVYRLRAAGKQDWLRAAGHKLRAAGLQVASYGGDRASAADERGTCDQREGRK